MKKQTKNYPIAICIIAGLFFIFGFVTWINSSLIPFMKIINELTEAQSYLVTTASYISFVVMALPSSYLLNKVGYKLGISIGLIIMGIGALIFIPAANSRTYLLFLIGIFIQGTGMAILQTAANPYITILGPIESGAKRISLMGIANKIAGSIGSILFGSLLLSNTEDITYHLSSTNNTIKNELLDGIAQNIILPYIFMAIILFLSGILIRWAPLPEINFSDESNSFGSKSAKKNTIFNFPHLWLGALALFVYVGAEVIAGDTIIAYGISLGIPVSKAKFFTTFTLLSMIVTYIIGIVLIPKYVSQTLALKTSAISGIIFTLIIINTTGFISVLFVSFLGISNALVWPAIWPLAIKNLGKFTKNGSAILVMAISGGAIIPPIYGKFIDFTKDKLLTQGLNQSDAISMAATNSYWILLPCYIIILYYAIHGYKIKKI